MSKPLWMQGALAFAIPLITSALAFGIAARGEFAEDEHPADGSGRAGIALTVVTADPPARRRPEPDRPQRELVASLPVKSLPEWATAPGADSAVAPERVRHGAGDAGWPSLPATDLPDPMLATSPRGPMPPPATGPVVAPLSRLAATVGGAADASASPGAGPSSSPPAGGEQATTVAFATETLPPPGGGEPEDEEERESLRALERVLVEQGGMLLPEWAFEIDSKFSYSFDDSNGLHVVDGVGIVEESSSNSLLRSSATLRLGLPWNSQMELEVPYVFREEEQASAAGERSSSGSGLGDVEVGLMTQLLRESNVLPDLLASVRWKTPTGESAFDVGADSLGVGSGFHAVSGQLTAAKTLDPLVFYGSLSHAVSLPETKAGLDIDPGDVTGLSLGAILATGPATSLRFGFEQRFSSKTEVDGRPIPGSDIISGLLELGASVVLPFTESRSLLSATVGIGLTEDAPDMRFEVRIPYRF